MDYLKENFNGCNAIDREYCSEDMCIDCPWCDRDLFVEYCKKNNLCVICKGLQIKSKVKVFGPEIYCSVTSKCNVCGGTGRFSPIKQRNE